MLSAKVKAVIGIIIAGWLVVLLGLNAWNVTRPTPVVQGSLESTLTRLSDQGLRSAGVMPIDVYGDEIVGAMPVCPGVTPDVVESALGVDPALFTFENGVIPEATNYMVIVDKHGDAHVEKAQRAHIDLCSNPQQLRPYQGAEMMFFLKDPQAGNWLLVG